MAYSRRSAGSIRSRSRVSRSRRAVPRRAGRRTSRTAGRAQTVKLVIQTTPYGGPDPFATAAPAKRPAKH